MPVSSVHKYVRFSGQGWPDDMWIDLRPIWFQSDQELLVSRLSRRVYSGQEILPNVPPWTLWKEVFRILYVNDHKGGRTYKADDPGHLFSSLNALDGQALIETLGAIVDPAGGTAKTAREHVLAPTEEAYRLEPVARKPRVKDRFDALEFDE